MEYWTLDKTHAYPLWRNINDPSLYCYIQPGGCIELYQIEKLAHGAQSFPHFCDGAALVEIAAFALEESSRRRAGE